MLRAASSLSPSHDSNPDGVSSSSSISEAQLTARLQQAQFQWPLKPYGVDKSNVKTAIMNKGAETRLYMEQLEARGLYDPRNPTGPLPTSLRPQLNRLLQQEGVSPAAIDLFFQRLTVGGKENEPVTCESASESLFQSREAIDYYDFLEFLGKNSISWN